MDTIAAISSILFVALVAYYLKKLDLQGAIAGVIIATVIWKGGGLPALFALFVFFISGTLSSALGKKHKEELNSLAENGGKRGLENVLANGGLAALFSGIIIIEPIFSSILNLMFMCALATACSDTLSSELGNVYGSRYFDILTFEKAKRGPDGVVSWEGILFGIAGSAIIGACAFFSEYGDLSTFSTITIAGLSGNIADSYLGAIYQRRGKLNNHQVNFIATFIGAFVGVLIYLLVSIS